MIKILIVEDEESILMALKDDLTLEGYDVASASNGRQGLRMAKENRYDLIVLDIILPELNGFEVCKALRTANVTTPIVMLTAKSQDIDKVLGLELGADDYVTKPFSPREFLARIKAILRRSKQLNAGIDVYRFNDVEIDFKKYEAKKGGNFIYLTALEYALLHFFIQNINNALSRDEILNEIWGEEVYVSTRTVDTHVAHLRKKLEDDPGKPKYIVGVRGVGYKFMIDDF
ncbi:MAG: response regulator transcription factor [bacterium]